MAANEGCACKVTVNIIILDGLSRRVRAQLESILDARGNAIKSTQRPSTEASATGRVFIQA